MKRYIVMLVFLTWSSVGYSKVELNKFFADNMVLQQSASITISGKANANAGIRIATGWKFNYKVNADKTGNFTVEIKTPRAGGPYNIKIDDGELLEIKNILIGEVWVAAGQSNMEMKVKGFDTKQPVLNREAMVKYASGNPKIRFFTVDPAPAEDPKTDVKGNWEETNANTVLEFSAVAYEFASKLYQEINVPIGIIVAANSGTRIESWMSRGTLESINDKFLTLNTPFQKNSPAAMYNAMIAPLAGFKIKGFLWYQGEANRMAPGTYLKQFPAMVDNWRQVWKEPDLPFYIVEIAPYTYPTDKDKAYVTAFFRENQRKLSGTMKNIGIISTVDIGSELTVHPPDKTKLGNRLALSALANTYSVKNSYNESVYKSFKREGNRGIIEFTNSDKLQVTGQHINDIEIAGDDQLFYPAESRIEDNRLIAWSKDVPVPRSVRYCFKAYSVGNLFNQSGLPIPPFRTDSWSIIQKK